MVGISDCDRTDPRNIMLPSTSVGKVPEGSNRLDRGKEDRSDLDVLLVSHGIRGPRANGNVLILKNVLFLKAAIWKKRLDVSQGRQKGVF